MINAGAVTSIADFILQRVSLKSDWLIWEVCSLGNCLSNNFDSRMMALTYTHGL